MNQDKLTTNENLESIEAFVIDCPDTDNKNSHNTDNSNQKPSSKDIKSLNSIPGSGIFDDDAIRDRPTLDTLTSIPDGRQNPIPAESEINENVRLDSTHIVDVSQVTEPLAVDQSRYQVQEPETKIYLNKIIAFAVMMLIISSYLLLIIDYGFDDYFMFSMVICYLSYLGLVGIFSMEKVLGELWLETDEVFKLGDILSSLIVLVSMLLRLTNLIHTCYFACIPFIVSAILYSLKSAEPINKRLWDMTAKYFYFIQTFIVTIRIDGFISADWIIIFIPTYIYFIFSAIYAIKSLSGLFSRIRTDQTSNRAFNSAAFAWFLVYRLSILVMFWVLVGFFFAHNTSFASMPTLRIASYLAIGINIPLLLFTVLKKKALVKFVITFRLIDCYLSRFTVEESMAIIEKTKKITLEAEDAKSYFLMISPTYYLPLSQYPSQDKTNIEKAKSMDQNLSFSQDNEEKNCYVCCRNLPNVIFTSCGHGGVCYDCAIASVKQKDECLQCRQKIKALHKIEVNETSSLEKGVVHSIESYRIVKV